MAQTTMTAPVECPICQNVIGQPDEAGVVEEAITTPCGHVYGFQCLQKWLAQTPTCPLDRIDLTEWMFTTDLVSAEQKLMRRFDRVIKAAFATVPVFPDRVPPYLRHSDENQGLITVCVLCLEEYLEDVDAFEHPDARVVAFAEAVEQLHDQIHEDEDTMKIHEDFIREVETQVLGLHQTVERAGRRRKPKGRKQGRRAGTRSFRGRTNWR